jgi:transcriptional antiterminator RfaH
MDKRWFAVQTKSNREDFSAFHLRDRKLEVYLPKLEVVIFHARKKIAVRKPLFPGYLFVRADNEESLDKIRWTKGIIRILLNASQPVYLNEEIIEEIRRSEDDDGIIHHKRIQGCDKVRIARGPFKDLTGTVERWLSDNERVKILLDLVSYQASVELHPSMIERVA